MKFQLFNRKRSVYNDNDCFIFNWTRSDTLIAQSADAVEYIDCFSAER